LTPMKNQTHLSRRSLIAQGIAASGGLALAPVWARAADRKLRIAVLDHRDKWTKLDGAAALMETSGAEVVKLDLNKPADKQNLDAIILGSFISEDSAYVWYMRQYIASIVSFVEAGGVVLQFTQADQHEPTPPFLADGLVIQRRDVDPNPVIAIQPDHPLLKGLVDTSKTPAQVTLAKGQRTGGWEAIHGYKGFTALAAGNAQRDNAVLLEAKHGKGRYLITALHFDRLFDEQGSLKASPDFFKQAKQFAQNIATYTALVRDGKSPAFKADKPQHIIDSIAFTAGAWTLAVMPDTQKYSESHPEHFDNQTKWILDQATDLNIQHALHVGDVVNRGMLDPKQWDNAERALSRLIGKVPLGVIPGNHDYDDNRGTSRKTQLNKVITPQKLASGKTLVELFEKDKIDNQAHAFQANDQKWLMLGLEFGPRNEVLDWAKKILKKYSDHQAVVFTHAYMFSDETRYDHTTKKQAWNPMRYGAEGSVNDGEMMWQKAIRDAPNVRIVTSGHVLNDGQGYLESKATPGHSVHQILQNYQMKKEGGQGYLRLYEFQPDGKTVQAKSYSPSLDRYKTDPANQFKFTL
ncbi:MAG: metallophosphoesterase, partial [Phycisphaeraceae bacterium]